MKIDRWGCWAIPTLLITLLAAPSSVVAQRPGGGDGTSGKNAEASTIKPYAEVITDKAETLVGLFQVHRIGDKVFYEIPTSELDRDMLWVTTLEQTQAGFSIAGMPVGDRVVRWEKRGEQILPGRIQYRWHARR